MKIVVLDGFVLNPGDISWKPLEKLGDVKVYNKTPKEKILERSGNAEVVFISQIPFNRKMFEKMPNLKYIGVLATGYNIVDIDAARDYGVTVTNIPSYGTSAVAQFVFALLLEICHHVWKHNVAIKNGKWTNSQNYWFWDHQLIELQGKTLGIIGFGRIGQAVAKIAQALGMKVLAYDTHKVDNIESETLKYAEFDELLSQSNVISLHCPLFESTKEIINKNTIEKMKDGVIIINTARGALVKEEDLAKALESGKVAAAGVDVLSSEPPNMDNPLINAPNCIVTPHIAWAPLEARERMMQIAANNLEKYLEGNPVNVVSG